MTAKVTDPTIQDIFKKMVVADPQGDQKIRLREISKALKQIEDADGDAYFGFELEQLEEDGGAALEKERTHILMSQLGFKEIDPSFLAWRKKTDQLPAYIIVEIESGRFRISVEPIEDENEYNYDFDPDLPDELKNQFEGVMNHLDEMARKKRWGEISIETKIRGFMSDPNLRKKVEKLIREETFTAIYLIAEAGEWAINKTAYIKDDPIVVGWVEETAQMFVIGAFDLTSLEDHILINHTF